MPMLIEAYEDWGPATGTPARGTNRTLITNCNLKSISDPEQNYFLYDVNRPKPGWLTGLGTVSVTRFISFKVSGTYRPSNNARIVIPKGFAPDNWRVMYKLTNSYVQPATSNNDFGNTQGVWDSSLITLTDDVTLFPKRGTSPETASSFANFSANQTYFTQYLVLQFMCHQSEFDDVDNFGTEQIKFLIDEWE